MLDFNLTSAQVAAILHCSVRTGIAVLFFNDGLKHPDRFIVIGAKVVIASGNSLAILAGGVKVYGEFELPDHDSKGVVRGVVSTCEIPTCTYNLLMFSSNIEKPPAGNEATR